MASEFDTAMAAYNARDLSLCGEDILYTASGESQVTISAIVDRETIEIVGVADGEETMSEMAIHVQETDVPTGTFKKHKYTIDGKVWALHREGSHVGGMLSLYLTSNARYKYHRPGHIRERA